MLNYGKIHFILVYRYYEDSLHPHPRIVLRATMIQVPNTSLYNTTSDVLILFFLCRYRLLFISVCRCPFQTLCRYQFQLLKRISDVNLPRCPIGPMLRFSEARKKNQTIDIIFFHIIVAPYMETSKLM